VAGHPCLAGVTVAEALDAVRRLTATVGAEVVAA
jgi:hypothetical protein